MKASASRSSGALSTGGFIIALTVTLFMFAGCAAQRPLRFAPKSISHILYNPKNCTQMPDGKFLCKDVVFTVTTVDVRLPEH